MVRETVKKLFVDFSGQRREGKGTWWWKYSKGFKGRDWKRRKSTALLGDWAMRWQRKILIVNVMCTKEGKKGLVSTGWQRD